MKEQAHEIKLVITGRGDPSVGIQPIHEEITVSIKYGGYDESFYLEMICHLKELYKEFYEADYVYTADEWQKELDAEREYDKAMQAAEKQNEADRIAIMELKDSAFDSMTENDFCGIDEYDYFREQNRRTLARINGAGGRA